MKHCLGTALIVLSLVSLATAQDAPHYGIPIDWSSRHVVSSAAGNVDLQQAIRHDPRQVYNWMLHNRARAQQRLQMQQQSTTQRGFGSAAPKSSKKGTTAIDWSFPLGAGTVPQHSYPAKYSFDAGSGTLTAANCTSDYVVYGLNVTGSSSQPNLVRLINIYAGTGGLCGTNPTVASAYNVTTVTGGIVQTSPALSLDGTKVAFIESGTSASVFHVLTWGTTGTNGSFSSNLYTAAVPGSSNNAVMTSLSYSTATTTYSSPYIDYVSDHAYFADDNGKLYQTTCVFYCVGSPAISGGWPVTVAAAGTKMSPPVWDSTSNKVFIGASDGKLYLVNLASCPGGGCAPSNITVGSGTANGGVFDGVLLDNTFGTMFAFSGDNAGAARITQTDTSFSFTINFNMGSSAFFPVYAGALDDAYYQNAIGQATLPTGNVFACGQLGGSGQPDLYWVPFTKNAGNLGTANPPRMNTAASSKVNVPGNPGIGCNGLTEFKNGATDRLFFSQSSLPNNKCVSGQPANGCAMMYDITTPASTIGAAPSAAAIESAGTSGMVVDNASGSAQASSIYFSNLGTTQCTTGASTPSYCAVKLTQSLFQ